MRFKDYIKLPIGLSFVLDQMQFSSSISRSRMLSSTLINNRDDLTLKFIYQQNILDFININNNFKVVQNQKELISKLHDISSVIARIGSYLDDTDLFQIKSFCILSESLKSLNKESEVISPICSLSDLKPIIEILDPSKTNINSFFIYDSYSEELSQLRIKFSYDSSNIELFDQIEEIEKSIRLDLSKKLISYTNSIEENWVKIVEYDILVASVLLLKSGLYSIPNLVDQGLILKEFYNPEIQFYVNSKNGQYQPIDLEIDVSPLLLTGANMGGKSVVLKSLALIQVLTQFAIPVPAKLAKISIVNNIYYIAGENEEVKLGFSSFAGDMIQMNSVIRALEERQKLLILIDEPAKSTNPKEGSAIVTSLIERISEFEATTAITTHYDIQIKSCKKMRVRGLIDHKMNYEIIEDPDMSLPMEALEIAKSLMVDNRWIERAEEILLKDKRDARE